MSAYRDDFDYNTEDDDGIEFLYDEPYEASLEDEDDTVYSNTSSYPKSSSRPPRETAPGIISEIFSYVKIILVAVVIAFVFTRYIVVNAQVPTGSMKNTIMEGDRLIGFRLSYTFGSPKRGDIIIFKYPDDETQNYVKRVIGTPGDVVQIIHGQVYVNGEALDEPYLLEPMTDNETELTYIVPEDCYFVLGDNRNVSLDSRYWNNTYVARSKILAKVMFRYFSGTSHTVNFKTFN